MNHHNHEYDGGSPDIPLAVGDRYYAQDLGRDFWHQIDQASRAARAGKEPGFSDSGSLLTYRAGLITKGSGDTLNMPGFEGYAWYQVKAPSAPWSVPPPVQLIDVAVLVKGGAESNMALSEATLDGVSTNYIKLRFKEAGSTSRARAKKTGSYVYERAFSYEYKVNTTTPTKYDIQLGTLVGTTGSFTITNAQILGQYWFPIESGLSVAAGDVVMRNSSGNIQKYRMIGPVNTTLNIRSTVNPVSVQALDATRFVAVYIDTNNYVCARVGQIGNDGTISWGSEVQVQTVNVQYLVPNRGVCVLTSGSGIFWDVPSTTYMLRTVGFTVSGLAITLGSTVNVEAAAGTYMAWVKKVTSTTACCFGQNSADMRACVLTLTGTTVSVGTIVSVHSGVLYTDCRDMIWLVEDRSKWIAFGMNDVTSSTTLYYCYWTVSGTVVTVGGSQGIANQVLYNAGVECVLLHEGDATTKTGQIMVHMRGTSLGCPEGYEGVFLVDWNAASKWTALASQRLARETMLNSAQGGRAAFSRGGRKDEMFFIKLPFLSLVSGFALVQVKPGFVVRSSRPLSVSATSGTPGSQCSMNDSLTEDIAIMSKGQNEVAACYFPTTIIGIALNSTGRVAVQGELITMPGTLTPNADYYVLYDGSGITTDPGSGVKIGRAITDKDLLIDIEVLP